jgi:hypothetical protein
MRLGVPSALVAVAIAFGSGLAASRLLEREALAQSGASSSTVFVPADGLAFRAFDGRIVAKLSYDSQGGTFELYDDGQQPAASFRTSSGPSAAKLPAGTFGSAPAIVSPSLTPDLALRHEPVDLGI